MIRAGNGVQWFARLSPLTGNARSAVAFAAGLAFAAVASVPGSAKGQIPCRLQVAATIQAPAGPLLGSPTYPNGISPNGHWVVGRYNFDVVAQDRGWIYEMPDGPFTPLPHPPGFSTSRANAVTDSGKVVGFIAGTAGDFGFVFDISSGQFEAFIPPSLTDGTCTLVDMNANGMACGVRTLGSQGMSTGFTWNQSEGAVDLGFIDGISTAFTGIAENGVICGYRGSGLGSANTRGLIVTGTTLSMLPPVTGGTSSGLTDVNEQGDACGYGRMRAQPSGIQLHSFVWSNDTMTMLGTLPAMNRSTAHVMMNNGVVAGSYRGTSTHQNAETAFLWFAGAYTNVDDLLAGSFKGHVQGVSGAANDGTLACYAYPATSDDAVAIVLRPAGINPGDVTHDCVTNVSDLLLVVSNWGKQDTAADANNDGVVNVTDLLLVISNWGT